MLLEFYKLSTISTISTGLLPSYYQITMTAMVSTESLQHLQHLQCLQGFPEFADVPQTILPAGPDERMYRVKQEPKLFFLHRHAFERKIRLQQILCHFYGLSGRKPANYQCYELEEQRSNNDITFTFWAFLILAIFTSFHAEREICPFGRCSQAHRTTVGSQSSATSCSAS
jgi:hypothetical protein